MVELRSINGKATKGYWMMNVVEKVDGCADADGMDAVIDWTWLSTFHTTRRPQRRRTTREPLYERSATGGTDGLAWWRMMVRTGGGGDDGGDRVVASRPVVVAFLRAIGSSFPFIGFFFSLFMSLSIRFRLGSLAASSSRWHDLKIPTID